ncbi:MAG: DUF2779 domain-containing protein [Clostridia bacterium]|nr:DUF2779 domain-containing protein [Clostridia bacterium]
MYFSKSKYCEFMRCAKSAWLSKHKREFYNPGEQALAIMATGNEVGDLAMGLFGEYIEVTVFKENGSVDIPKMLERTREELAKGTEVICEASFDYNGLYCAVDILKKTDKGYAIYEVKSSTRYDKIEYVWDVAYQKSVLTRCGINVDGVYLVYLSASYERGKDLNLQALFNIEEMSYRIRNIHVDADIAIAKQIVENPVEPDIDLSKACGKPHECPYWNYCTRSLPSPSVFDLYRMGFEKKLELYRDGIISIEDVRGMKCVNHRVRKHQVEAYFDSNYTYVDKKGIGEFLCKLSYPMYFLDFETMMCAVPVFEGTHCYQQVPFQYSLHYIEREGGEVLHKEFLAQSGVDPREEIARRLCEDIPTNACVIAYNKQFECARLTELADAFPCFADHLLALSENAVDLLEPFGNGYCYNSAMGSSFSVKSVLPALYPSDPELDYKSLSGVHNGNEAMKIYPQIAFMNEEDAEKTRRELKEYCKLDTFAMVKIWQKLTELAR